MIFPIQLLQININKLIFNQQMLIQVSKFQYNIRQSGITMIKKYLASLFHNLKENPKVVGAALVVGLFGLAIYGLRIKEINRLYQINQQRNLDSCQTKLQNMGLKNCQKIRIPLKQQHGFSSSQSLSTKSTINIEEFQCEQYLEGWHIRSPSKIRKNSRLIIFYHSQHTKIQENLNYVKNLVECTVSDVLIAVYRFQKKDSKISHQYRNQLSMKNDAQAIFNKGLQIALKQKKDIIVLGKDLGAVLGIYLCSLNKYQKFSSIKGLVIQNPFSSLLQLRISQIQWSILRKYAFPFYKFILRDKWQSKQEIRKIKIPMMLLIKEICSTSEALLLYCQYPGRKILHQIMQKEKDNRKIENLTDYFLDIDIFLNNLS